MQEETRNLPHFYLSPDAWQEDVSLAQVLRCKEGECVVLLDGKGRMGQFVITKLSKKSCFLKQKDVKTIPRPTSRPILALALSKAVRRGFFMEKAVELGAHAIWLWQGDTSQGKIVESMQDAFQRQMIAGAKQCRNPWIPSIALFPKGLSSLLMQAADISNRILPWELQDAQSMIGEEDLGKPGETLYVIGPEGGFSDRELALLDEAAFKRVSLGSRILRCETAAVLCLGLHWWAAHRSPLQNICQNRQENDLTS